MSLLTIVQEAAGSLNQPVPAAIFGSTTGDAVLWRNLAQREGRELARRHDWQVLIAGAVPLTLGTTLQTALPTDYDRFVDGGQIWNYTLGQKYQGPADHATWMQLVNLSLAPVPGYWRLVTGSLYILPVPTAGQTLLFNYISKNWCQSSGGTGQSAWAADADTGKISEELIALGLTWRWLRAKGMDYAEDMETYEREVEKAAARDRGWSILTVGGNGNYDNIPPALSPSFITV